MNILLSLKNRRLSVHSSEPLFAISPNSKNQFLKYLIKINQPINQPLINSSNLNQEKPFQKVRDYSVYLRRSNEQLIPSKSSQTKNRFSAGMRKRQKSQLRLDKLPFSKQMKTLISVELWETTVDYGYKCEGRSPA